MTGLKTHPLALAIDRHITSRPSSLLTSMSEHSKNRALCLVFYLDRSFLQSTLFFRFFNLGFVFFVDIGRRRVLDGFLHSGQSVHMD